MKEVSIALTACDVVSYYTHVMLGNILVAAYISELFWRETRIYWHSVVKYAYFVQGWKKYLKILLSLEPLPIRQVTVKSYLPIREIYLFRMTGRREP